MARLSLLVSALFALLLSGSVSSASAQSDDEIAGRTRRTREWGESSPESAADAAPQVHRNARFYASLGIGGTLRLVQYDDLGQDRFAPPYLQLRGAFFFEGDGNLQHGAGIGLASNISGDGLIDFGYDPFTQWTLSPTYFLRYWMADEFSVMGHFGVPFALTDLYTNWGLELGVTALYKPVAGVGIYVDATFSSYFASSVHPLVSAEVGVSIDYELIP